MTIQTELRDWAMRSVGLQAARLMASEMPDVGNRKISKEQIIDWLLANDLDVLMDSYLIELRAHVEPELCGAHPADMPYFTCTVEAAVDHTVHRRGRSTWTAR